MDYMRREWRVSPEEIVRFVHGTTVATNAVIEAKGAKIGLLTTAGFKDVLEIGRQMRHAVYDLVLKPETPVFLAPGALRKEVGERVTATGEVLVPLDESSVVRAADELVAEGVESIAVSYLFSFLDPAHERRTREIIAERHPQHHGLAVLRGRSGLPRVRAHLRDGVRRLHQAGGRTLPREDGAGPGGGRCADAAPDHAVAGRHQLLPDRPAAPGAALPVGPRRRRHRRPGGRPRGRDRRPDHRRYRRHELRHRPDQPRPAAHPCAKARSPDTRCACRWST